MKIGDQASFEKTITEFDIEQFAGLTGDFNPIHISKEAAKESIFGQRIAHGMLVASLVSNVLGTKLPGPDTIYMEQVSKFLKPVFIGDTVKVIVEVDSIINKDKGIIKLKNSIYNQDKDLVVSGYSIVKVRKDVLE